MLVSIIIPTTNEEANIGKNLESVKKQTYLGEKEIIIVDKFSTDGTVEIARRYTDKIFTTGPERSAQRNFGLAKAAGQYCLFLDADMTISPDLIKECVEIMENNSQLVGLYIPEIISGGGFWVKVRRFERSFYDSTVIDGLRFLKTEAVKKIGGFDEKLYAAEDWDLDKRLKKLGGTAITKSPLFHNEAGFSLKKYLRKKRYYIANFDAYIKKWGKDDQDIRKQFSVWYRYFGVFLEYGKWKKLLSHPILAIAMYFLRFLVGVNFILRKIDG